MGGVTKLCSAPRFALLSRMSLRLSLLSLVAAASLACGGDDPPPPPPTQLEVTVTDAATGQPIDGAQVVLIGQLAAGQAITSRAPAEAPAGVPGRVTTAGGGKVLLTLAAGRWSLRVDALGHHSAPEPFQPALVANVLAQQTTAVTVALEPRDGASDAGTISGRVTRDGVPAAGVLVHAESTVGFSTLTDFYGQYVLLGLNRNLYRVEALVAGAQAEPRVNVDVAGGAVTGVDFALTSGAGATITATVGGSVGTTSVSLALVSTGEVLPGGAGRVAFGGSVSLTGVPRAEYVVHVALEDDDRVLSPDLLRRRMPALVDVTDTATYQVALPTLPAVNGLATTTSSGTASFRWDSYPGAGFYVVEVRDLGGRLLWGGLDARGQPQFRVLAPRTEVAFGELSPALESLVAGRAYRLRVYAARDVPATGTYEMLAGSEALDGRFRAR